MPTEFNRRVKGADEPMHLFSLGTADTALAQPSGAGGGASAHFPQSADYVGNVSVCRLASLAVKLLVLR